VRFWGVRGSVPWATPASIGCGCNTPSVEVADEQTGAALILDAGSGIVGLGEHLGSTPRQIPILLTHYHWDHLQGLPFFSPLYKKGWEPSIWAPALHRADPASVEAIFQQPFFPVPAEALPSRPRVSMVQSQESVIGGFHVQLQALTHPGGSFAYRIHGQRGDLVYATDHEFGEERTDAALAQFCRGAADIILDAHFTPDEIKTHRGWGHATWRQCAELAAGAGAGRLWLFHHKPGRSDEEVAAIEAKAREIFPSTEAAREGRSFEV
jgi:phosphoribosyl 1,2-cyclic phosphodiesterase